MTTQRQESGSSISGGCTTENDFETSGVPSSPTSNGGGTLERITPTPFFAKPDKAAFQAEEARIKSEINAVRTELTAVRSKLSSSYANGPGDAVNDKRAALYAELNDIRGQHPSYNIQTQIKDLESSIDLWTRKLQAAQPKSRLRTVADVETRIRIVKEQIKSGSLGVADEECARRELSHLSSSRETMEVFQSRKEADRRALRELRRQLDNPELKTLSDRYEAIATELNALEKEVHEFYVGRAKLIQERDALQAQLNDLWKEKRDVSQKFRDATDRYWAQAQEGGDCRCEEVSGRNTAEEAT
ncbi:hypothetical protein EDD17DRAFT_1750544 [Pisolithus thermaeus]|nr:hypothetical protein EV401DRAFT_2069580 [Pisolithus croceorrhizus]KAI6167983.1 hypothetical protein EDD17DRAFT_1750544 [Pisolithus thermaeus]